MHWSGSGRLVFDELDEDFDVLFDEEHGRLVILACPALGADPFRGFATTLLSARFVNDGNGYFVAPLCPRNIAAIRANEALTWTPEVRSALWQYEDDLLPAE